MATPIVLGVEGEAQALVEEAGAGLAIEPENAEALVAAVTRLADDAALRATLGDSGHAFVHAHFDRSHLAGVYLELLENIAATPSTKEYAA